MSYIAKPSAHHPALPRNAMGLTRRDYEGTMSTLCAGCGHDSITAALIEACFEMDLPAHRIAKVSGIGCSSKAPTYFLSRSHGFNSVHGRMPSITTGANIANRDLVYIGVSGDGDTASIGLGQFCHAVRRRVNMTYIVMNNGCYGLTKGQFSATNDKTSPSKKGEANPFDAIDLAPDGDPTRRRLRRPLLLRRQGAAHSADQGRHQLQRLRLPRCDQPVRDLQQPPDLDQELRLRARPQHGVREHARLRRAQGGDHRRLRRGHVGGHRAARRLAPGPEQARSASTTRAMRMPRS